MLPPTVKSLAADAGDGSVVEVVVPMRTAAVDEPMTLSKKFLRDDDEVEVLEDEDEGLKADATDAADKTDRMTRALEYMMMMMIVKIPEVRQCRQCGG